MSITKTEILSELSSQVGDRTNAATHRVAEQCLSNPELLSEIAAGLASKDSGLVADCAEVMTKLAETQPQLVAPYADDLIPVLKSKHTRSRWEAMHAIMLITPLVPEKIAPLLPQLSEFIRKDNSVIVRDYATSCMSNFAASGKAAAEDSFPYLQEVIEYRGEKHAARALEGLLAVAKFHPNTKGEVIAYAEQFVEGGKGVTRKMAAKVLKSLK